MMIQELNQMIHRYVQIEMDIMMGLMMILVIMIRLRLDGDYIEIRWRLD